MNWSTIGVLIVIIALMLNIVVMARLSKNNKILYAYAITYHRGIINYYKKFPEHYPPDNEIWKFLNIGLNTIEGAKN